MKLDDFNSLRSCLTPERFWGQLLLRSYLPWDREMYRIIRFAISIPLGTALCERGFSIMGGIKTLMRNRLSDVNTENELRIVSNSNRNLEQFNASYFAKEWINAGHLRSDDPSQIRTTSTLSPLSDTTAPESIEWSDDIEIIKTDEDSGEPLAELPRKN